MNLKDEKKKLRNVKIRYFLAGMCSYIIVYAVCVLLFKMVQMIVGIPPIIELIMLVVFFVLSVYGTKRIMRMRAVMKWVIQR